MKELKKICDSKDKKQNKENTQTPWTLNLKKIKFAGCGVNVNTCQKQPCGY